jgi:hypothetical protein
MIYAIAQVEVEFIIIFGQFRFLGDYSFYTNEIGDTICLFVL